MNKYWIIVLLTLVLTASLGIIFRDIKGPPVFGLPKIDTTATTDTQENRAEQNPLTIEAMRKRNYPGSSFIFEQTLKPGSNYQKYVVSYQSDGLKIYGLLTVSNDQNPPADGWPAIVFNHGFIPPETYKTTERYVAYVDGLARQGYIVFKPDYRGHGKSEGQLEGAYYSPAYAIDSLNALESLKNYGPVNPRKIGMWGHSMGGNIVLRDIVTNNMDIKAAVIWGGVVGSYEDLMNNWQRKVSYQPPARELSLRNNYRKKLTDTYGTLSINPQFWQAADPTYHLDLISTPVQLHAGSHDEEVPSEFSQSLKRKLAEDGKVVEYYEYPGGNHNLSSPNFELAMKRSVEFFDKYLKGGESK